MSALETYAKVVLETRGIEHMHALQSLRHYINLTDMNSLIRYVNTITDIDILRAIQEAGARGDLYSALISRMNLLMKEQQEAKK